MADIPRMARILMPVGVLGTLVAAGLIAATLLAGGSESEDQQTLPPDDSLIPVRPSHIPTLDPQETPGGTPGPPPLSDERFNVDGIEIMVPEGGAWGIGIEDPSSGTLYVISHGDLFISFKREGLIRSNITPDYQSAFSDTLDAVWSLTQKNGEPAPAEIVVNGHALPLPEGSYLSTHQDPFGDNTYYSIRLNHSVVTVSSWGVPDVSIAQSDAPAFEDLMNAVNQLDR